MLETDNASALADAEARAEAADERAAAAEAEAQSHASSHAQAAEELRAKVAVLVKKEKELWTTNLRLRFENGVVEEETVVKQEEIVQRIISSLDKICPIIKIKFR